MSDGPKRRPDLIGAMRRGRAPRRGAGMAAPPSGMIAPEEALEQANRRLDRDQSLSAREWAASTARALRGVAAESDDPALAARVGALEARLEALDEADIGPVRAELAREGFSRDRLAAALARVVAHEQDALARRLFAVDRVPERQTARPAQMVHYVATSLEVVRAIVAHVSPEDVFFDVGSGLGYVTMLVACLSGARAVGIEYEPAYHARAVAVAADLGLTRVEHHQGDARAFDYGEGTVFYFYDPFRGEVFDAVAARLRETTRGRPIRVISRGQSNAAFEALDWLEVIARGPHELLVLKARSD